MNINERTDSCRLASKQICATRASLTVFVVVLSATSTDARILNIQSNKRRTTHLSFFSVFIVGIYYSRSQNTTLS